MHTTDQDPTAQVARAGSTLRWAAISPSDVPAWTVLTNELARADGTEEFYQEEDLAEELQETGVDPALDTWAVHAGAEMVAYGQVRVSLAPDHEGRARIWLSGGVHPDHRGRGIGRELVSRQEERGAALAGSRMPGVPAFWRCDGGLEGATVRDLLDRRGYVVVRYFHQMRSLLPRPAGPVQVPAGVRLVPPRAEHEHAVHAAHTLAFRDHWGSADQTPAQWHDHWVARSARPDLSVLALDEEGQVLAYVLTGEWVPGELYVNLVGTIPQARGRGLARAALGAVLDRAQAHGGYTLVDLHVDSASPTGATRLYEAVGFAVHKTYATYERVVPVP